MGIGLGDAAVRRPARVRDADPAVLRRRGELVLEFGDLAYRPAQAYVSFAVDDRDPGGIIAAILEATQALDENGHNIAFRDRTNDSAHEFALP